MTDRNDKCGTKAGYEFHKAHREPICGDCRDANNVYMREWRKTPSGKEATRRDQLNARARDRALIDLCQLCRKGQARIVEDERVITGWMRQGNILVADYDPCHWRNCFHSFCCEPAAAAPSEAALVPEQIDLVAIHQRIQGIYVRLTPQEAAELVQICLKARWSLAKIAAVTGLKPERYLPREDDAA